MKHTIKEIIKNNTVKLLYCQSGKLFYSIDVDDTNYIFPVDVTDRNEVGDGVFQLEDKAIIFMRYIRKAIESNEIRWSIKT